MWGRIVRLAVLGALGTVTALHGQTPGQTPGYNQPSSSQVNCRDPFWAGTPYCPNQNTSGQDTGSEVQNGSRVPGTDSSDQAQRASSNTQVYVDNAGTEAGRRQNEEARQNNTFLPDPVIDLQRLAKASTGEALPVFGRDLFLRAPSTFAPSNQTAPLPDYVVGPGDQILLRLSGHDSLNGQLTVDSSGSIYVPHIGAIHVAGLRFDQLESQISAELSRSFRNFKLSVNLGQLRSLQVYVVGEARKPGVYTLGSFSTVLNALLASGGPNVQGSLRRIQVRHQGQQPATEFDLYDLVLHGNKSSDVRLQPGDTIFIPAVGPQVALAGSVRHPAIYELKDGDLQKGEQNGKQPGEQPVELRSGTTVSQLLALAGGYSPTASRTRITLERIEDGEVRRTLDVGLDAAGLAMTLRDGDVLFVGHITRGFEKTVTIRGNLANAGRFTWHPGMRLSEIIPDRNSLLTNNYWRERNLLGVPTPLFEPRELYLPPSPQSTRTGIGNQGSRDGSRGDLNGSDRQNSNDLSQSSNPAAQIPATGTGSTSLLGQLSAIDQQQDPAVVPGGTTAAAQADGERSTPYGRQGSSDVNLTRGSLAEQQEAAMNSSLASRGTPNRINIPAPEIDWSYAVIERLDPVTLRNSLVPFNLGRLVQDHDPTQDLELEPGDVVTILSQTDVHVPIDQQTKYVRLEGEFLGAGTYSVHDGETLADLVRRAGGLTPKAYLFGASFTRETARVLQQQRLDEYVSSLSIDMERSAAVRTASSTTGITDPNALVQERSLVAQLKQLRATGRIVLEFRPDSLGTAAIPNLPLEDGDVFRVPSRPLIVSVIGAVYGQNIFLYDPSRRVADYLELAGKPNRIADGRHAFIIRADGSIYSRERAQGVWTNTFPRTIVNPGDTIVIPEKLIKPSALRQVIDYSQIFSQFALGAAAINVVR